MSWGCKPENYPNGCGWAARLNYPRMGLEEWWCDVCERSGDVLKTPVVEPDSRCVARYDKSNKAAPGGASTPLIQGPRRTSKEFD